MSLSLSTRTRYPPTKIQSSAFRPMSNNHLTKITLRASELTNSHHPTTVKDLTITLRRSSSPTGHNLATESVTSATTRTLSTINLARAFSRAIMSSHKLTLSVTTPRSKSTTVRLRTRCNQAQSRCPTTLISAGLQGSKSPIAE